MYKHCRIQPSEIENMCFYEVEYTIENLTNDLKNKQETEENQANGHDADSYLSKSKKMMSGSKNSFGKSINTPKIPKMPSMKSPKFR